MAQENHRIQLPTEPQGPDSDIRRMIWLLYGARKVGKTSLVAQIPNNLLICAEHGARAVRALKIEIDNWEEFMQVAQSYAASPSSVYRCCTIDTVDALWDMCLQYVCRREGVRQPGDRPYGEVWSLIEKEWVRWLRFLTRTERGLILISHADINELVMKGDRKSRIEPTLPRTARRYILAVADIITYMGYEEDRRILVIRGSEHIEAGCRMALFTDNSGQPIDALDLGDSAEEAYRRLTSCIRISSPLTPVAERSPTQIKRIRQTS